MACTYILYNPLSGAAKAKSRAQKLAEKAPAAKLIDVREITSYETFFSSVSAEDSIILCGGDGTVNHFANDVAKLALPCKIYYYAVGSGNDFARDLGHGYGDLPNYPINDYLCDLPEVEVGEMRRLFVNGIGYGIDGYCCEVGDIEREKRAAAHSEKPINYAAIAIRGLLGSFRPKNAVVTVDGVEHRFSRVWLAPTMHGHYYGGGMMPSPTQDRENRDAPISTMVFHKAGMLRALLLFPSLFKGEHVKHKDCVTILTGHEITVEYDSPCALQIDGETVKNVTRYTARAVY